MPNAFPFLRCHPLLPSARRYSSFYFLLLSFSNDFLQLQTIVSLITLQVDARSEGKPSVCGLVIFPAFEE
jgi:hypothetical protein